MHLYEGRMCTGNELLSVPRLGRMTKAGYLLDSMHHLLKALKAAYRKVCPAAKIGEGANKAVCMELYERGREEVMVQLAKVRIEEDFELAEFQPTDHHGEFYAS